MIHYFPEKESRSHKEDTQCNCYPFVIIDNDGGLVCIHQSFKGTDLKNSGFIKGLKTTIKSRCGHTLIEGDIVEHVNGTQYVVIADKNNPQLMLPDETTSPLTPELSKILYYVGNVYNDLNLKNSFFTKVFQD